MDEKVATAPAGQFVCFKALTGVCGWNADLSRTRCGFLRLPCPRFIR